MKNLSLILFFSFLGANAFAQNQTDGCVFDPPSTVLSLSDWFNGNYAVPDLNEKCPHGISKINGGCCYACYIEGVRGGKEALANVPRADLVRFQGMIDRAYVSVRDPRTIQRNMAELLANKQVGPIMRKIDALVIRTDTPDALLKAVMADSTTKPFQDEFRSIMQQCANPKPNERRSPDPIWRAKVRIGIWVTRLKNSRFANQTVRWAALSGPKGGWPTIPPLGTELPQRSPR